MIMTVQEVYINTSLATVSVGYVIFIDFTNVTVIGFLKMPTAN